MRIHNQKDFFAGLLLAAFGLLAVVFSRNYPAGIAARWDLVISPFCWEAFWLF